MVLFLAVHQELLLFIGGLLAVLVMMLFLHLALAYRLLTLVQQLLGKAQFLFGQQGPKLEQMILLVGLIPMVL